eukprot:Skav228079  [mRNA]  locus=scaffold5285:60141:65243:- [translate_table: standard]
MPMTPGGPPLRTFNSKHIDPQRGRFQRWLQAAGRRTVALLEIGCGCSEHSLRMTRRDGRDGWTCMSGEWKIPRLACPLVRIDPAEEREGNGGNRGNRESRDRKAWQKMLRQRQLVLKRQTEAAKSFGAGQRSMGRFPKSGKGSPLNFFSDKNSAKFGSIPGLPGSAQKRGSSSDMLGTMSLPFVCDSTSQGINSAECASATGSARQWQTRQEESCSLLRSTSPALQRHGDGQRGKGAEAEAARQG